ncbi:MAG: hypothetical protein ACRCWR_00530 [Saezia sp.]
MQTYKTIRQRIPIFCLSLSLILSGCASNSQAPSQIESQPQSMVVFATSSLLSAVKIPVVRYGRYTLVEIVPEVWQIDLLSQIIVIAIPKEVQGKPTTVADAMRHVLKTSGYTLCNNPQKLGVLQTLPVPVAHQQLGPLTVHDALLTLAGSAWEMQVNEQNREVCFVAKGEKVQDLSLLRTAPVTPVSHAIPMQKEVRNGSAH